MHSTQGWLALLAQRGPTAPDRPPGPTCVVAGGPDYAPWTMLAEPRKALKAASRSGRPSKPRARPGAARIPQDTGAPRPDRRGHTRFQGKHRRAGGVWRAVLFARESNHEITITEPAKKKALQLEHCQVLSLDATLTQRKVTINQIFLPPES